MPLPEGFSGFPEPQYTRTPNLIFDELLPVLSGSQLKVLLFIVRTTMGWRKDHEYTPISTSTIQEGTGLSNKAVLDAAQELLTAGFIMRQKRRDDDGRQGSTAYRLRFTSDIQDQEQYPECEKFTLARVNKTDEKVHSGGGAYNNVFKETKRKLLTPTSESEHPNTQPPQNPILDTYPPTEEPIEPKTKTRMFRRPTPKGDRPHGRSDRIRELREMAHSEAQSPQAQSPYPGRMPSTPDSATGFPARWNELVSERPVDPTLLGRNPKPYSDPAFQERFPEICSKAKELIAAGADLTFGFLLSQDRSTEQFRWQQLLAGQLGWMAPKKNGSKGPMTKTEVDQMYEGLDKALEKEFATRTKRTNERS